MSVPIDKRKIGHKKMKSFVFDDLNFQQTWQLHRFFKKWSLLFLVLFSFRMSYLELRNAPITIASLLDVASRHYRLQLVQQFYVLVLGLNILGNPYSYLGDFSKERKDYYDPFLVRKIVLISKCLYLKKTL